MKRVCCVDDDKNHTSVLASTDHVFINFFVVINLFQLYVEQVQIL